MQQRKRRQFKSNLKHFYLLSTKWVDYVQESMKYQALRPKFFSMGGWGVVGQVVVGWVGVGRGRVVMRWVGVDRGGWWWSGGDRVGGGGGAEWWRGGGWCD